MAMLKKLMVVVSAGLVALVLMGASGTIDGKTARALVSEKKATLIDVRTEEEFAAKHIDGAINIPVDDLEKRLPELKDKKTTEIVVYCQSGGRSAKAAALLKDKGFTKVNDLGGMKNW